MKTVKNGRKVLISFMKKLFCLLLALTLSVSLFISCGSGTSIAIGALRLDNQVENLFKFTDAVAYNETLVYTDKDGAPMFTAEYYYEVAEDIYSTYNLIETIGDYTLYAYEGSVYTETPEGMTAVLLLSGSYLDFVNTYFVADFLLDGETHIQRSSETKDDVIIAQYETVLTPQQQARVSELGVMENDKIVSEYAVRGSIIESIDYFVERDGALTPLAKRAFRVSNEKEDRFGAVKALSSEKVSVDFIFVDGENQGRHFEVPKGVYVGMEIGTRDYAFFYDTECTKPYAFDDAPIVENLTLYVTEK